MAVAKLWKVLWNSSIQNARLEDTHNDFRKITAEGLFEQTIVIPAQDGCSWQQSTTINHLRLSLFFVFKISGYYFSNYHKLPKNDAWKTSGSF